MIHRVEHGDGEVSYVASAYGSWRPGSFDAAWTAQYSLQFAEEALRRTQENLNPGGCIQLEHLRLMQALWHEGGLVGATWWADARRDGPLW